MEDFALNSFKVQFDCLQYILSIVSSASKVLMSRLSGENKKLYAKALSLAYDKELVRYLTDLFL